MSKLAIIIVLLFCPIYALADTHYASKIGSDTYPYSSWGTAARVIQNGINASSYGDTVRVGSGSYWENLSLIPGIVLIGAGMDSCTLNPFGVSEGQTMMRGADSSIIEGFHLLGRYPTYNCYGILSDNDNSMALKAIRNNKITDFWGGITLAGTVNTEISNNIFLDNYSGIYPIFGARGVITNNTFTNHSNAIAMWASAGPTIRKNVIINTTDKAIYGDFTDSMFFENNLVVVGKYYGIALDSYGGFKKAPIRNNTLIGDTTGIGGGYFPQVIGIEDFSNEIKNNIISKGYYGIATSSYHGHSSNPQVSYNDLWNNTTNYCTANGSSIDTSLGGNIYLDPMFVGVDDYHLQYASPCIDAGDPNIKDPDSTRSDIGFYGGTYGETYSYIDYPPKPPDSLSAVSESTIIILTWKPNTESDLSYYLVYKDTIVGFIPDTFNIVGNISKDSSIFKDYDFVLGKTYYYRVSVWDLTGHQSEYSDQLEVQATSVDQYTENGPPLPKIFELKQNSPNPFNPSTTIVYYLPDVGYQPAEVEIFIYNILGQKVRTLVKERKYPGKHQVTWDGKDEEGNDLASGIYFYRLTFSGTDLYPLVKPKKMVLIR